jgi:hypothetical protein
MILTQEHVRKGLKTPIVALLIFFFSAGILLFFRKDIEGKSFFMMIGITISYYSYINLNNNFLKQISKGILIGLFAILFVLLVGQTFLGAKSNDEFDFMCFYMQGQLGVHHLNFYDPNSFSILLHSINYHFTFSETFKSEILDVGLLSPPITMLFFAPLASVDYHTSKVILALLTFIFIIANTILANVVFVKKGRSIYSFFLIFIIIMLIPGTQSTIGFNQTNFFLLFFLILTIHKINKPISGFYLALSLIIKPISGILILFFIIHKKWKQVAYFIATGAILLFITGFIWGFQNIFGFIQSPPTLRLPKELYVQHINQSLIGVLNRNLQFYGLASNVINMLYDGAAIILLLGTCISSKRLNKVNSYLAFFPFILFMLIVYPSSLTHYMVYLIPIIIYFLFLKFYPKYVLIVLLISLSFAVTDVFFTYIILWSALLCISVSFPTLMRFQRVSNVNEI